MQLDINFKITYSYDSSIAKDMTFSCSPVDFEIFMKLISNMTVVDVFEKVEAIVNKEYDYCQESITADTIRMIHDMVIFTNKLFD